MFCGTCRVSTLKFWFQKHCNQAVFLKIIIGIFADSALVRTIFFKSKLLSIFAFEKTDSTEKKVQRSMIVIM